MKREIQKTFSQEKLKYFVSWHLADQNFEEMTVKMLYFKFTWRGIFSFNFSMLCRILMRLCPGKHLKIKMNLNDTFFALINALLRKSLRIYCAEIVGETDYLFLRLQVLQVLYKVWCESFTNEFLYNWSLTMTSFSILVTLWNISFWSVKDKLVIWPS